MRYTSLVLFALLLQLDPNLYSNLRWRMLGPFRAGRVNAVSGVAGQPDTFYFGSVGGGLWKSQNSGRTWTPTFDSTNVASIGAIGIAPSNSEVIYVGTGEADMRDSIAFGNGVYKSSDAGKTWKHLGLENTKQIGCIIVDPKNPNTVFVAALGNVYAPNPDRGVYRSRDGAPRGKKFFSKMTTSARSTWLSIHWIPKLSTQHSGMCGVHRGLSTRPRMVRAQASSNRSTVAQPGEKSRKEFHSRVVGTSALQSRSQIAIDSMR